MDHFLQSGQASRFQGQKPPERPCELQPQVASERKILVVEDEVRAAEDLALILRNAGYQVDTVSSAEEAIECFGLQTYHMVITDLMLPGRSGVELTRTLHEACPGCAVVLVTGHATVKTAVAALKRGAADYIRKPFMPPKLLDRVHSLMATRPDYLQNRLLSVSRSGEETFEGMTARSRVMHGVFDKIRMAARSDATVLIVGESGTGKELVARAIHQRSLRANGPFIPVHTGAIPRDLIAAELFGHERGAFTGAMERKEGKFELAENGSIFLDEISTMDERTQISLLRVLESFTYTRVGGKRERRANVRVVAATNRDLGKMVNEGAFREDVFYRMNILQINLPPLRERREDIALLASGFIHQFVTQYRKDEIVMPADTQRILENYPWPGNVRELRNVIEQAVLLTKGNVLRAELLPQMVYRGSAGEEVIRIPMGVTLREAEREIIVRTLESRAGNKRITAQILGISRRSLYNKLAEYTTPGSVVDDLDTEFDSELDSPDGDLNDDEFELRLR